MDRFYVLRNAKGEFFAGFRSAGNFKFAPVFVIPKKGQVAQANILHGDDIDESQADLLKAGIVTERIQVG